MGAVIRAQTPPNCALCGGPSHLRSASGFRAVPPQRRGLEAIRRAVNSTGYEGQADFLRAVPIVAGAGGFVACLVNRTASNVSPVLDSASSQVRFFVTLYFDLHRDGSVLRIGVIEGPFFPPPVYDWEGLSEGDILSHDTVKESHRRYISRDICRAARMCLSS